MVKNPALGNQRLDQHIHCQTHAHVVSHGERSPWVIRRSLPDAIRVPECSERLSPVRSDGEGGLSKHGVQVGSPNARHVSIVPSRHRIPSFDVSKPTQTSVNLPLPPSFGANAPLPCARHCRLHPICSASGNYSVHGMCNTPHAKRCDRGAIRFGRRRSFRR